MSTFQFKLDPSSLPKLDADGSNYLDWRPAWKRAFRYAGLLNMIEGTKSRLSAIPADQEAWDHADDQAFVMLLSAVHNDLSSKITSCETSAAAWKELSDRFDRDTGNATIYLFRMLTSLRYEDGDDLHLHLDAFRSLWQKLATRTATSQKPVAKAMKSMFDSDEVKGSFFLTTLPEQMDHVVDNLSTQNLTKYSDIEPKMLDIATRSQLEDSAAYYTSTARKTDYKKGRASDKQSGASGAPGASGKKECTWCRARQFNFIGHLYNECKKLAEHKRQQDAKRVGNKSSTAHQAVDSAFVCSHDACSHHDEEDEEDVTAFQADVKLQPLGASSDACQAPINAYAATIPDASISSVWIFDSGASKHMSGQHGDFINLQPRKGTITVAGGAKLLVEGVGTVELTTMLSDRSTKKSTLTNVIYGRQLGQTRLFSWTTVRNKFQIQGAGNDIFLTSEGREVLWAKYKHGNFEIQSPDSDVDARAAFASYDQFHEAFAHSHITQAAAKRLYSDGELVPTRPTNFDCDTCRLAKSTRHKPASLPQIKVTKPFEMIYSDLSGKFSVPSLKKSLYFMVFVDAFTRYAWLRFLRRKKQAARAIDRQLTMVETQFSTAVAFFGSDQGGEYAGEEAQTVLAKHGTTHRKTPPYHHEVNGVAERYIRTLATDARAMLRDDEWLFLWPEAIAYAQYLRNIKPHTALPCAITPYERLYNKVPSIGHIQPFWRPCYLHIPEEARKPGTKLLDRAETAHFVGFELDGTTVHRVFVPTRRAITTASTTHLAWNRTVPKAVNWSLENTPQVENPPQEQEEEEHDDVPIAPERVKQSVTPAPEPMPKTPARLPQVRARNTPPASPVNRVTRAGRILKPTVKVKDNAAANVNARGLQAQELEIHAIALAAGHSSPDIPLTYRQALKSDEALEWEGAIDCELNSHDVNETWTEVDDEGQEAVDPRWVFAKKYNERDELERYKARLVAKGFTQIHGVNYDDTYAPVARYDSLRLIFAIAGFYGYKVKHVDVETAYLQARLKHLVYMRPPPGYRPKTPGRRVLLLLLRALYGLKQSGREWYGTLTAALLEMGLLQCNFDPCIFIGKGLILGVYVDDLLLAGTPEAMEKFMKLLTERFKCRDLGLCKYILGLEVNQSDGNITISQRGYAQRILERFGMTDCTARKTPADPHSFPRGFEEGDILIVPLEYQSLTGSLNFLVTGTRADLAFTIGMLSCFNAAPTERHLRVAKQVLRYLKGTLDYCIIYRPAPQNDSLSRLEIFSDASYNTDPDTARSFGGYVVLLNGIIVAWSAKRQKSAGKSTCEVEYMAASSAASHLLWTIQALRDLDFRLRELPILHCDNQPALSLMNEARVNSRTKHIAVHFHFVRQHIGTEYTVQHIPTADNLADICTKALPRPLLEDFVQRLGLVQKD